MYDVGINGNIFIKNIWTPYELFVEPAIIHKRDVG